MDCKECDGLLVAYVKGELSEEDAKLVERHMAGCGICSWNAEAARQTLGQLHEAEDPPVIKMVSTIVQKAIEERASDIHIDPLAEPAPAPPDGKTDEKESGGACVRVRYRIDGVLHEVMRLPRYLHAPLTCRFMLMSDMNPYERRVPQFGRIPFEHGGKRYDLRAGTLPTTEGMRVMLRLFDQGTPLLALDGLGLSETNLARIREVTGRPSGVFLIAGPAGGGKSSFAYALLNRLTKPEISILTIEDPVEVRLPGVSQVHVNRKAGMGYAEALKAMMRQDPDIILCAEVPDGAVADLLNHIALTGHLVLAPVVGNDATDGLKRYLDVATDSLTTGKALIGVVGMRLVRTVCAECAEDAEPSKSELGFLQRAGITDPPGKLKRVVGCETCRKTGYRGRTGIHEVLLLDDELRERIRLGQAGAEEIRAAISPSMLQDAAEKAAAGITTIDEAERVTSVLAVGY